MIPSSVDADIQQFVATLKRDAGANLECVMLYGSAANGEYHEEFSNVNLMFVLRDTSLRSLEAIAKAMRAWTKKQPAPLIVTRAELERSTDVFSIELLDMKQHHKVLFGDDALSGLDVPLSHHRVQVEYELREKLILLRQRAMMAANDKQMLELLVQSVPSFSTLFRHALIALGKSAPTSRRESITQLAQLVKFESASFVTVLDIREHKLDAKKLDVKDLFARYLAAVEQVVAAVDQALER
jgi:predicted nucleotidyltransferase